MRGVYKIIVVTIALAFLIGPAFAFMPSQRGVSAPQTVWSDLGSKGTVSGKVVTTMDQTKGVEGAYVALVNAMNPGKEYFNATTDADGNYQFKGVNATFSSALYKGPDGTGGTYQQGMSAYMIYANTSGEEIYSGSFGVDTNRSNNVVDTIIINAGTPDIEATPEPTAEPAAPPVVAPAPPAETPTATPEPAGQFPIGLLLTGAVLVILAVAAVAAYFLFLRKKQGRKGK